MRLPCMKDRDEKYDLQKVVPYEDQRLIYHPTLKMSHTDVTQ